jgi:hypothetical protein
MPQFEGLSDGGDGEGSKPEGEMGLRRGSACALALGTNLLAASASFGERIDFLGPDVVVAGGSFSLLARLTANSIPLYGYSLNVNATPKTGAVGRIVGNPDTSNFYLQENLIEQGGGHLDDILSVINAPGDNGLFVTGVNEVPLPVMLAAPGHDILVQLVFDVAVDVKGFFEVTLGPGSILVHVPNPPDPPVLVEFETIPKMVQIVPVEPSGLVMLGILAACVGRRPRQCRLGSKRLESF